MHMSTCHTCWSTLKHRFHMIALHVSTEFLGRRHQHCFNIWEAPGIFLTFRSDFRVIAEVKGDLIEPATMRSLGETELSQVCSRGWYGMVKQHAVDLGVLNCLTHVRVSLRLKLFYDCNHCNPMQSVIVFSCCLNLSQHHHCWQKTVLGVPTEN